MIYSTAFLLSVLASSAFSFSMPKGPQRLTSLKMAADPWFPDAETSNVVEIDALRLILRNIIYLNEYHSVDHIVYNSGLSQ